MGRFRPIRNHASSRKSIFNKVVGDSAFELRVAEFVDGCEDIVSFAKNMRRTGFTVEYRNAEGEISNYVPDFIVKQTPDDIWVIETKGREDIDDPLKRARLRQWCDDATDREPGKRRRSLRIREEDWGEDSPRTFDELAPTFALDWVPAG